MSEETALTLASETNLRLVALDPAQLQRSQQQLMQWSVNKVAAVQEEVDALQQNLDIAKKAKWNTTRPMAHLKMAQSRLKFYQKLKDALDAGYYIVPDMPCDIFAIRTDRNQPTHQSYTSEWPHDWRSVTDEKTRLLPSGEGEYQNPDVSARRIGPMECEENGKKKTSYQYREADHFNEIVFPFMLAKPQVLDATQRAMALKIFDEIGVCPQQPRKKDPMVIGIIKQPKRSWQPAKQLSFLIAWFLDTDML